MKKALLKQAEENGHLMVRVSPNRYECRHCPASIYDDQIGHENWQSSKTGNLCADPKNHDAGVVRSRILAV